MIRTYTTIILIALFLPIAFAGEFELRVSITSEDGEQRNIPSGKTFSSIIEPGEDNVKFEIELENDLPDETHIRDVITTVTLLNVSERNITVTEDAIDLNNQKTKIETVQIDIPRDTEELLRKVIVQAVGTDENDTEQRAYWEGFVRIEDVDHEVEITNVYLNQSSVSCGEPFYLAIWLENKGKFDESDASASISNEAVGISETKSTDLDEDDKRAVRFDLSLPDAIPGIYPIALTSMYDDIIDDVDTTSITVNPCIGAEDEPDSNDTGPTTPIQEPTQEPIVGIPAPVEPQKEQTSSSNLVVGLIVAAAVLLIIVAISLVLVLGKKK